MRPTHILILLLVLIILFGAKRLPDVARSIGQSMKVFKKEVSELQEEESPAPSAPVTTQPATPATPAAPPAVTDTAPAAHREP